jgi:hypothetical protein
MVTTTSPIPWSTLPSGWEPSCRFAQSRTVARAGSKSTPVMIISSKIRRVGMTAAYTPDGDNGCMPAYASRRDPLSVWFDPAARRLLERAYRSKGEWTGVYLAPPSIAQRARAAVEGEAGDLTRERDRWGEVRWVRAFKRATFWQLNHYGSRNGLRGLGGEPNAVGTAKTGGGGWAAPVRLEWDTGQRVRLAGWPTRRWAIRVRIHGGGAATSRAGLARPERERWIGDDGRPTSRQSTIADQPWNQG